MPAPRFHNPPLAALLVIVTLLGCITASNVRSQPAETTESSWSVDFFWTYACFGADRDGQRLYQRSLVDFTYAFDAARLDLDSDGVGRLQLRLKLIHTDPEVRDTIEDRWIAATDAATLVTSARQIRLLPGCYRGTLRVADRMRLDRNLESNVEICVPDFSGPAPVPSDIELITTMAPEPDPSNPDPMTRLGYVVNRNLTGVVSQYLHAYLELYDLDRMVAEGYTVTWQIADTSGGILYTRDSVYLKPESATDAVTFSLPVSRVPAGRYVLAATVSAGRGAARVDSVRRLRLFYVRGSEAVAEGGDGRYIGEDFIDPLYSGLTEDELDQRYEVLSIVLRSVDKDVWNGLDGAEAKGRFLTRFWLRRDDDPSTAENPARDQFLQRVEYARANFRSSRSPRGWDSDRGRVLVTYGQPDQVHNYIAEYNRRPYEIWEFRGLQAEFFFVDIGQTGAYQLVHSTYPGEISNYNWEREHAQILDDPNELGRDDPFRNP